MASPDDNKVSVVPPDTGGVPMASPDDNEVEPVDLPHTDWGELLLPDPYCVN